MSIFSPNYVKLLQRYCQSSIRLRIGGETSDGVGISHFGGKPDVPDNFVWPVYKNMPLAFLMQLSCAEFASLDINHELPNHGVLSFFYALDNDCFGYDNRDRDGFRVYWFDGAQPLHTANFVVGVSERNMLPRLAVSFVREASYPHVEDFTILLDKNIDDYSDFESAEKELGIHRTDCMHRMLGWADLIQNNASWNCEIRSQGYSFGAGYRDIPDAIKNGSKQPSVHRWKLLLQLGTVKVDGFTLMFGDAGKLYFYVPQEDLKECRFDRVYGEMQCY